ncbi:diacylglycerol kinase family lipid kinase [Stieleria sp. JC731]|uniref:diacylglycerol/lipid kinase family protein n=1 Tax=Pirellulaceae TaxID=2691357 RepID=UPI001E5C981C|nr:diacylglycerol kinase family protein [Stieleria sp. JC731]MCC9598948.1 diacylglycerol kinase family lipid kinase [Stieleria sp. JC731]
MSHQRSILLMINRQAGRAEASQIIERATQRFAYDEVALEIFSWDRSEADRIEPRLTQAIAQGTDTVIAAGGDGTVSRIAQQLIGTDVRLGVVPLGTANLIARELELPIDVEDSIEIIAGASTVRQIDGMKCIDRTFFSHVSMGTYSRLAELATPAQKARFGKAVYLWHGIREIVKRQQWSFDIEIDGNKMQRDASLVIVANIGAFGIGDLTWGKHIAIDDQSVDVCVVKAITPADYSRLTVNLVSQRLHRSKYVEYFQARQSVKVMSQTPIPVRGDGNRIDASMIDLQILPQAVTVFVR